MKTTRTVYSSGASSHGFCWSKGCKTNLFTIVSKCKGVRCPPIFSLSNLPINWSITGQNFIRKF